MACRLPHPPPTAIPSPSPPLALLPPESPCQPPLRPPPPLLLFRHHPLLLYRDGGARALGEAGSAVGKPQEDGLGDEEPRQGRIWREACPADGSADDDNPRSTAEEDGVTWYNHSADFSWSEASSDCSVLAISNDITIRCFLLDMFKLSRSNMLPLTSV